MTHHGISVLIKIVQYKTVLCNTIGGRVYGRAMSEKPGVATGHGPFCEVTDDPSTADLGWLAHRATHRIVSAFDALAVQHGLSDLRDWLVLSLAGDGNHRTQLEIATQLVIDKTTMVLILDRLERGGLIVRTASPSDRRVRIPEITAVGAATQSAIAESHQGTAEMVLEGISAVDRVTFREVLWCLGRAGQ